MNIEKLLKGTFNFHGVPFIIKVEKRDLYIKKTDNDYKIRGVNVRGCPTEMSTAPRGWKVCRGIESRVRPDYPHKAVDWTDDVETHHKEYEPLEVPTKGILFYSTEERKPQREPQEIAEDTIESLKEAYEDRPESLDINP